MIDRDDLEILLKTIFSAAVALLEDDESLVPLAVTVNKEGEVAFLTGPEDNEHPDPNEVVNALTTALRESAEAGSITASAIAHNASVREEGEEESHDAIVVRLRAAGLARDIVTPYEWKTSGFFRKKKEVIVGRAHTQTGDQDIFI